MPTVLEYLRWLRNLPRRIRDDVIAYQRMRKWWAQGLHIVPSVTIEMGEHARIEVDGPCSVGAHTVLMLMDDPNLASPSPALLRIGQHTSIGEFNNIRASGGEIVIGNHCMISQFVSIIAANHSLDRGTYIRDQPWDQTETDVHIGDDVWVGVQAVILPGVTIGRGCVIGAGAVVTSDIPEYAIAVGVPAKVKGFR